MTMVKINLTKREVDALNDILGFYAEIMEDNMNMDAESMREMNRDARRARKLMAKLEGGE